MTKPEAKAISQRLIRATQILTARHVPDAIRWEELDGEQQGMVQRSLNVACEEISAVLEMVDAELGE